MENLYDVIIIGSGPAGLSAAIYAKRAKLSSLTIEANFASGGQVLNTYEVDNYPGLPGISGMDLGSTLRAQAPSHARGKIPRPFFQRVRAACFRDPCR